MTIFELTDVTCRYQDVPALRGLSVSLAEGARVAVVGANGSGKTTLLRMLDGLVFPEVGTVRYRDVVLSEAAFANDGFAYDFRRRVGLVFQDADAQLFNPTVFDEVAFGPLQLGWSRSELREKVDEALERLRIGHLRDRVPQRLSTGEKKRVALASVLVLNPEVLLLDEPTAGLDPKSESQVIDLLVGWAGGAKTVVTATHDLGALEDIADRCCVLHEGRLVADADPRGILSDVPLLERANLVHAHRHHHPGREHSHPHLHGHGHDQGLGPRG
ncbi:MAG: ATPase component NikO of energizing module of nickel transporter [Acidobacteria bacterium]|nr:ATPase component NikO of energizing module of nickel transporter [Acidobacteriota bacterium]